MYAIQNLLSCFNFHCICCIKLTKGKLKILKIKTEDAKLYFEKFESERKRKIKWKIKIKCYDLLYLKLKDLRQNLFYIY